MIDHQKFKFRKTWLLLIATAIGADIDIAIANSTPIACQPYVHGKLRKPLPTFFCMKKEDASAFIELLKDQRLKRISQKDAALHLAEYQSTKECFFVTTQHTSIRTVHQEKEPGSICNSLGLGSTKWPSLLEARLSGDQSTIWVLTNAMVPPVAKPDVNLNYGAGN